VAARDLDELVVPAARNLPSPRTYLAHLEALQGNPQLVRLSSNENTRPPSPRVREALERAYDDANLYPPLDPPLRAEIATRHGVDVGRVLLGAGSTELIDALLRAFVAAGDDVVLPTPSWPVLRARLAALDANLVDVPLSDNGFSFHYDADALIAALTPRTKLLVVCTPNNPTGNAMSLDELRRCAKAAPLVLVDAAYADFDLEDDASPLAAEYENVVVARTFSKGYALAGLRVGYVLGSPRVLDYVARLVVPGSSASSASLAAASAAFGDRAYVEEQIANVREERERLIAELRARGLKAFDSRANFVAVDGLSPEELLERGVVIRRMDARLARITVGTRDENDAVLRAIDG
jgi:histidinol-phosphate aminotransferase